MAKILLIETSTNNCSVALAIDNEVVACNEQTSEHYVHAEMLHTFIQNTLGQASIKISELNAIAVSKGPGSYTGLRIGVSAAKGLAFASNLPLIAISSLQALAWHAHAQWPAYKLYHAMLDARRSEVYTEVYNHEMNCFSEVSPVIIDEEYLKKFEQTPSLFIGDGALKCEPWLGNNHKIISVFPSATMMAKIANEKWNMKQFEDLAYFEPYYLKDFIPGIAKKAVL